jgi:hypothetical protein
LDPSIERVRGVKEEGSEDTKWLAEIACRAEVAPGVAGIVEGRHPVIRRRRVRGRKQDGGEVGVTEITASAGAVGGVDGRREEVVQWHGNVGTEDERGQGRRRGRGMRGGRSKIESGILMVKEGRGVRSREDDKVIDGAHLQACFKLVGGKRWSNRWHAREVDCGECVLGEGKGSPGEEKWTFREFAKTVRWRS